MACTIGIGTVGAPRVPRADGVPARADTMRGATVGTGLGTTGAVCDAAMTSAVDVSLARTVLWSLWIGAVPLTRVWCATEAAVGESAGVDLVDAGFGRGRSGESGFETGPPPAGLCSPICTCRLLPNLILGAADKPGLGDFLPAVPAE
ncbi:hypothetical protein A5755_09520 [Mycolicibacterium fortuitum]|nr:hypothetical protein A5763_04965 [Mycolicibacterium fortuitum]OBB78767.1 hypothetical protein A5755_09520 [Mycolicibacterium fortuitum]OBF64020.1 hypothetical protein A5751_05225 [Mycolicibacterium fortuitum]OBG21122.1 hypothetical protein A5768_27735 [Mycolicibacterium fortuitum]